ncbi:MAG: DUF167 domain-containing protein [Candidatus Pacebacteria bacterium]|nr:DUF167 domain-containing protein [Candidatus Paceibacterota bacterium]
MFIKVKVFPSSKKEVILAKKEDSFEIKVREDPVDGRATERVIEILAEYFSIDKKRIRIIKGAKERSKIFELPDGN